LSLVINKDDVRGTYNGDFLYRTPHRGMPYLDSVG
jgi:hypothetical protein